MRCAVNCSTNRAFVFNCCLATPALILALCAPMQLAAQDKPGVVDIVPATPAQGKPAPTADKPAVPAAPKAPDFSKEAVVFDKLATSIREEADGTGTRQTTARIRILADAGVKEMAVLQFTYTATNQQVDIAYVRVVKPDGTVIVTPPYNVQDLPADVTRSAPMYSDIHQKHVAVKGLGVGDTLEYQMTLTTLKPEVPGHFWFDYTFQKDLIILDEQVDLDVPADKTVTVASADAKPTITTAANRRLYHWTSSNLARPDPDAPAKSTKHWKPSIQVTTFNSWEQVGAWYQSLQKDSLIVTPAIQAKADSLTKGLTSDDDKVHAIFNDVALHIHYVGLEFGIGRYQPHPADDVLSNEYGDCKDKHTLLAAELKAVGIESWPVLISSERELDPDTPSPAQFNHVITLVPLAGKLVWMDSTEEVAPVGTIMLPLRDKQALAIPGDKQAYLERTPAMLPYATSSTFHAEGKLDENGRFTAHIALVNHGDGELVLRTVFRQVASSQLKQALQNFSSGLGFGGEISNPHISDVEDIDKPFEMSWDYTREKFGEWDSHRIFPAMPPTGLAVMPGVKVQKPGDDVDMGSPGEVVYTCSIQLPAGYSLSPPMGVTRSEDWAEYKSTYKFASGVYSSERRLAMKRARMPLDQWDKFLAFRHAIYADEVETTYLFKGPAVAGGELPESLRIRFTSQEDLQPVIAAIRPVHDASIFLEGDPPPDADSVSRGTTMTQTALVDIETRSASANPDEFKSLYWAQALSYAWSQRGLAALRSKDLKTAGEYLPAAWQLSQDKLSGYRLAELLEAKGDKPGAIHLLELAHITSVQTSMGSSVPTDANIDELIESAYRRLAGHELRVTPLNDGHYNGSLREELDKRLEVHPILHTTKLNGSAFFTLAIQHGKPARVHLIGGDKALESLTSILEKHPFPSPLPAGSAAVLLREVRVICSEWAGCDADLLLPTSVTMPPVKIRAVKMSKPGEIELKPEPAH
jgi:hypothetical protein